MIFRDFCSEFETAVQELASVWNTQCESWDDPKTQEISKAVIMPVSALCKKIMTRPEHVGQALDKLQEKGLIVNK